MKAWTVITGASGSMGSEAVTALASEGRPVIMACRNIEKAASVRESVLAKVQGADIEIRKLDLASLQSVREFASGFCPGSISALFNNAGIIARRYSVGENGFEQTFAVNYFGPWLLTNLLVPCFTDGASVVNMISLTCRFVRIDERSLMPSESDFSQLGTYARAKRALLSFSMELARRYPGLKVNMADPGIVASNMIDLGHWYDPLADLIFKPLCKKPETGVKPALSALTSVEGDLYFVGNRSRRIPRRYVDPELDAGIWKETERLTSF